MCFFFKVFLVLFPVLAVLLHRFGQGFGDMDGNRLSRLPVHTLSQSFYRQNPRKSTTFFDIHPALSKKTFGERT